MPDFLPFRGLRYRDADLAAVTAPPYDVVDPEERVALAARDPRNAVRLILPEGDDRYARAAADLAGWRAAGVLGLDPAPRFYGYRMAFHDGSGRARVTHGVLGALVLPETPGGGDVLPHERTLPKAKSDRLSLLRATRANFDPIWGLSCAAGLSALLAGGPVLAETVDDLGVRHTLHAIDRHVRIDEIRAAVAGALLVLADGHHRFETAIAYRDHRRAAGVATDTERAILCLVVELADDQLWVQPIHRLLSGLPQGLDVRAALDDGFDVCDAGPNTPDAVETLVGTMREAHAIGVVDRHGLALLRPRADALDTARGMLPGSLQHVTSAWFDALVRPALPDGLDVTYRNDAVTVAALVEKRSAHAAVLLDPVTVDQIRAAALARVRMPEKTTFFAPKPRTGLVFRSLDD